MADTSLASNITSLASTIFIIYNNSFSQKPTTSTKMGILGLSKDDRKVGHLNYYISFGFAIVLNGLLIFAVLKRSTKILQSYHKVFAFTIVVDVSLSLASTLTMFQPIGANLNGHPIFFHIVEGLIFNPIQPWTTILATITIFFGIYNITVAPISFIYRYFIICHNYELSMLQFLCLCFFGAIGPGIYAVTILISELTASNELERQAAELFLDTDWLDEDGKVPHFGVMYTSRTSFNAYVTPLVVIISYTIVIFCTIKISYKISQLRQMQQNTDAKSRRSQRQLQIVLYCQALTPFLTSALSTFAIQIGKIFGLSNPSWFYYLNLLNTWAPVANPLIALIVIAPYRKFILRPCKSKISHDSTQHSNYITTQKSFVMKINVT